MSKMTAGNMLKFTTINMNFSLLKDSRLNFTDRKATVTMIMMIFCCCSCNQFIACYLLLFVPYNNTHSTKRQSVRVTNNKFEFEHYQMGSGDCNSIKSNK